MKKLWWLWMLLIVLAVGAVGVALMIPTVEDKLVSLLEEMDAAVEAGQPADYTEALALLEDENESSAVFTLSYATGYRSAREQSCAPVAVLTVELLRQGHISQEWATSLVHSVLQEGPISGDWREAEIAALPAMLECLPTLDLMNAVAAADVAENETMQRILGDTMGARLTLQQIADVVEVRWAQGKEGDTLVRRSLAGFTQEQVIAALAAETDEVRRAALARAYGMTLSDVDDVLNYLADARAIGISAVACYPEGAVVALDLSRLNFLGLPRTVSGEGPRYLVVHSVEAEEAFEYRDVPEGVSGDSFYYEGCFGDYYESNNDRYFETTTVTIDTAALDATPDAFVPSDASEIEALVVFDTRYTTFAIQRIETYLNKSISAKTRTTGTYRDYLCYCAVQRVAVFDMQNRQIWRFGMLETEPTGLNNRTDGFNNILTDSIIKAACMAVPDEQWMEAEYNRVMTLLQDNDGDLWRAIQADKGN